MAKSKSKRTTITREAADDFSRKLEQLPDKKKTELTPKELIFENSQQLDSLLERNYEYDDLVALLKEDGIQISKTTLRQYLSEARKAREGQGAAEKAHLPEQTPTHQANQSAQDSADQPADTTPPPASQREATPSRKKIGKSRLQSEENPNRYPGEQGKPIEIRTEP